MAVHHSKELALEVRLFSCLIFKPVYKLLYPRSLLCLLLQSLYHFWKAEGSLSPIQNIVYSSYLVYPLWNTPLVEYLLSFIVKQIALMQGLSYQSSHRVEYINSPVLYLPVLLLIRFLSYSIKVLRVCIVVIVILCKLLFHRVKGTASCILP